MKNSRSRFRKFGNTKTTVDGIIFDSKAESKHWFELKIRERAGEISNLQRQVTYRLEVNGELICKYIADYVYMENGQEVTADCKGFITPEFRIKAKLFKAIYGRDILIMKS
jgi:hypothetical protein